VAGGRHESRVVLGSSGNLPCVLFPSWVKLVHTWPPQEQSRAPRKAPFRTLKSLTCTGELGTVIIMTYTHRGIGPSATEDLVRKFARSERQIPRSAPHGIIHGRNMTQVGRILWQPALRVILPRALGRV
jgi:hypothetical protein